jgi:hypothetical protein
MCSDCVCSCVVAHVVTWLCCSDTGTRALQPKNSTCRKEVLAAVSVRRGCAVCCPSGRLLGCHVTCVTFVAEDALLPAGGTSWTLAPLLCWLVMRVGVLCWYYAVAWSCF